MAKLGDITLFVEDEQYDESVTATAYPVEKGVAFTDHVERNPRSISLKVFLENPGASDRLSKLRTMMHKGTILKYVGKATAGNIIILSLNHSRNTIKNGFEVSMTLQEVRIAKSPWRKAKKKDKATRKPSDKTGKKKPTSKKSRGTARYHIIKPGDTFWDLARKYGSSVQDVVKWNKQYHPRRIPIGVKVRVK